MKETALIFGRITIIIVLFAVGFNTLDWLVFHPSHDHPWLLPDGKWNLGPFWLPKWWAYIIFGLGFYGWSIWLLCDLYHYLYHYFKRRNRKIVILRL